MQAAEPGWDPDPEPELELELELEPASCVVSQRHLLYVVSQTIAYIRNRRCWLMAAAPRLEDSQVATNVCI
jgi:hypothetical protein